MAGGIHSLFWIAAVVPESVDGPGIGGVLRTFLWALVFLAAILFWIHQFIQLMVMRDDDLPGRHDKILWVLVFLVLFPVAPFAFYAWKHAYLGAKSEEQGGGDDRTDD